MCRNRALFLAAIVAMLLALGFLLSGSNFLSLKNIINSKSEFKYDTRITVSGNEIFVELAETSQEKSKGLSGRQTLEDNQGMLFHFSHKSYPSFWMFDMNFPIDIIWISDNTIVHIDENVPPPKPDQQENDLMTYSPPKPINYVLEVNAGFSEKHNIKAGDTINIDY